MSANLPKRSILRRIIQIIIRTDSELDAFCLDFFPGIESRFTNGMDRINKVNIILAQETEESILDALLRHSLPVQREQLQLLRKILIGHSFEGTHSASMADGDKEPHQNELEKIFITLEELNGHYGGRVSRIRKQSVIYPRKSSRFGVLVLIVGLVLLPISLFSASISSLNYQKMFLNMSAMSGLYVIIGMFFINISKFPENHRARTLYALVGAFVLITLVLGARAANHYFRGSIESRNPIDALDASIPMIIEPAHADLAISSDTTKDFGTYQLRTYDGNGDIQIMNNKPMRSKICPEPTSEEIENERLRILTKLPAHRASSPPLLRLDTLGRLLPVGDSTFGPNTEGSYLDGGTKAASEEAPVRNEKDARIPSRAEIAASLKATRCGPPVVPGTAEVRGSLDKELIRRVIKVHKNQVDNCYKNELRRDPSLSGRIMILFTIGSSGFVSASLVQSSTMGSIAVEQCLASIIRKWEFPKPQGGIVVVTYPFVFPSQDIEEERTVGRELISQTIQRHRKEVEWCIQSERIRKPTIQGGVVKVRFVIGEHGTVELTELISSTMTGTSVNECVLSAIRRWEFQKPQSQPIEVIYPFALY